MTKEEFILPVVREISYYDDESHEELGKGLYYSVEELFRLIRAAGLGDTIFAKIILADVSDKIVELEELDKKKDET